eukprot:4780235-Pleurochrysis_carterae.AAC.1
MSARTYCTSKRSSGPKSTSGAATALRSMWHAWTGVARLDWCGTLGVQPDRRRRASVVRVVAVCRWSALNTTNLFR